CSSSCVRYGIQFPERRTCADAGTARRSSARLNRTTADRRVNFMVESMLKKKVESGKWKVSEEVERHAPAAFGRSARVDCVADSGATSQNFSYGKKDPSRWSRALKLSSPCRCCSALSSSAEPP